eukprot:3975935-Pleurochrysis_carterae.AAC.2
MSCKHDMGTLRTCATHNRHINAHRVTSKHVSRQTGLCAQSMPAHSAAPAARNADSAAELVDLHLRSYLPPSDHVTDLHTTSKPRRSTQLRHLSERRRHTHFPACLAATSAPRHLPPLPHLPHTPFPPHSILPLPTPPPALYHLPARAHQQGPRQVKP